jgi:hypothetical protein
MSEFLEGCDGCRTNELGLCDHKILLEHFALTGIECPCEKCVVKMICSSGCEEYSKSTELVDDYIVQTGKQDEVEKVLEREFGYDNISSAIINRRIRRSYA